MKTSIAYAARPEQRHRVTSANRELMCASHAPRPLDRVYGCGVGSERAISAQHRRPMALFPADVIDLTSDLAAAEATRVHVGISQALANHVRQLIEFARLDTLCGC